MAASYQLDVQDGPRAGEKIGLTKPGPLLIGRTKQGIDLLDPRVSTRHAQIVWDEDRFWISDLGSATGTLVDGIQIGMEPVPMSAGTRILIGDSTMVLLENRNMLPQWVYWVALIVLALCTVPFINQVYDFSLPWHVKVPTISAPNSVYGHKGPIDAGGDTHLLPIDRCFMQETFVDARGAKIRRVTDFNQDGVSEIWIEGRDWERVYTFAPDGRWELLGKLPKGCQNSNKADFPPLQCGLRNYQWSPGVPYQPGDGECSRGSNLGEYQLENQRPGTRRSAVVWVPNAESGGPEGVPRPYQMGVKEDVLATWLAERGITKPVHFIVCEELIEGMSAQVLTKDGHIERLQPGCANTIELTGTVVSTRYKGNAPVAIAFTETGRRILVDEFNVYLGGSELGHFQNSVQRSWARAVGGTPVADSATLVQFESTSTLRVFDPIAPEFRRLKLGSFERLVGRGVPGMLRAAVFPWTKPKEVIETPCGKYVQILTHGWRCGPPCLRDRTTFMTVQQVNGPRWELPYTEAWDRILIGDEIEIEVDIHSGDANVVSQVIAASVAARDTKVCTNSGNVEDIPLKPLPGEE
jgi:hypothetical protein